MINSRVITACLLIVFAVVPAHADEQKPTAVAKPKITLGDGDANWIITEGLSRDGATFTFKEVTIQGDGWLVFHPFADGRPVGEIYAAASFVEDGVNENVEITVEDEPASGTKFLVMLHSDVNENGEFDFVFVDDRNVLDKAVFEGNTMIAHIIATP